MLACLIASACPVVALHAFASPNVYKFVFGFAFSRAATLMLGVL